MLAFSSEAFFWPYKTEKFSHRLPFKAENKTYNQHKYLIKDNPDIGELNEIKITNTQFRISNEYKIILYYIVLPLAAYSFLFVSPAKTHKLHWPWLGETVQFSSAVNLTRGLNKQIK